MKHKKSSAKSIKHPRDNHILVVSGVAILIVVLIAIIGTSISQHATKRVANSRTIASLSLTSNAFNDQGSIPSLYTCDSSNINPSLEIEGIDSNVKSLALIMDDPDAPSGTIDHWVKWNIPFETSIIVEGIEPEGVSGRGTSGSLTYKGPCPPSGTHHYRFKVYTLDTMLDLPEGSSKADLEMAMEGHIMQRAELVGTYSRNEE